MDIRRQVALTLRLKGGGIKEGRILRLKGVVIKVVLTLRLRGVLTHRVKVVATRCLP